MSTLRELLTAGNSDLNINLRSTSTKNTSSKTSSYDLVSFDENDFKRVQEWTDFTYEAINAAYGNLLDRQVSKGNTGMPVLSKTPTEIFSEEDIDTLGIMWTCNVVRGPLKTAGPAVMTQLGQSGLTDAQMIAKKTSIKHPTNNQVTFNPDWTIKDRERPALFYAMGDSKLNYKWKSEWLATARVTDGRIKDERVKPLSQMATYCRHAKTRYGFILTDEELVALRFRRLAGVASRGGRVAEAAVEYKSVKWAASGPGVLTVNLAIWALGMAGMNDGHRAMENFGDSMDRLTAWEKVKGPAGAELLRNVISGRVIEVKNQPKSAVFGDNGKSVTAGFTQVATELPKLRANPVRESRKPDQSQSTGGDASGQGQQSSAQSSDPSRQSSSSASQLALPSRSGNPSQVPSGNPSNAGGRQQGSSSAQGRNQAPVDEPESTKKRGFKKYFK